MASSSSTKTLNDFFGKANTGKVDAIDSAPPPPSSKRGRSSESSSPTGVTPPPKRADCENGGNEFEIPENAPSWVGALIMMMKKCTSRVDTFFEKLTSLEEHFTSQFDDLRNDINTVTASVAFLAYAHDKQLQINADQLKANNDLEGRMRFIEQNHDTLKQKCKRYEDEIDALEQYGRRNCLLLHGVPETEKERTDTVFCKTISEHLKLDIDHSVLDRSHRLGKPKQDGKPRPIIAKFARYNTRAAVFAAKKQLKGTKLLITESLTRRRVTVLNESIRKYGSRKVWTRDGEIYTKNNPTDMIKHIKAGSVSAFPAE